jgi:GNAT superfamily N-acetyltransferase
MNGRADMSSAIRPAGGADAESLVPLIAELGYAISVNCLREKLAAIEASSADHALVAVDGERLVGCVALHVLPLFHAEGDLGRITALVVRASMRGRGLGHALMASSHAWFRTRGCVRVEVTSGDHREDAHRFYARHGYARQGQRLLVALHP